MRQDVGIGVALESSLVRHLDTAQHELPPLDEAVYVEALPHPHR